MNYDKIYGQLIARGKRRVPRSDQCYERHHILPKCLGGPDLPENTVLLTPEEHFLAHQLLVKVYPKQPPLLYALVCMSGSGNGGGLLRSNKLYGWIRRKHAAYMKDRMGSLGDKHPMRDPKIAAKVSAKTKGVPKPWMRGDLNPARTEAFKNAVSGDKNPAKRPENRAKISARLRQDRSVPFCCNESGIRFETLQEAADWLHSIGFEKASRQMVLKVLQKKMRSLYNLWTFDYL